MSVNPGFGGQKFLPEVLDKIKELKKILEDQFDHTLLVAEDDLVNQKIIAKLLESLSYTYRVVGNGSECVKEWQNSHYDLILMDIQMPVMNGFETTD